MNESKDTASTMGLMKYVHVMFFVGALVVGWLFVMVFETAWTSLNLSFRWCPEPNTWLILAIGGGGACGLAFYLWRHPKVNKLAIEIVQELSKVTWPSGAELKSSTVVVIILSCIASIILGLFDFFWAKVTDLIYL